MLFLHQCLELVLPQWNRLQGRTSQPAPLPLFKHRHRLFSQTQRDISLERENFIRKTPCAAAVILSHYVKMLFLIIVVMVFFANIAVLVLLSHC